MLPESITIVDILAAFAGFLAIIVSLITASGSVKQNAFANLEKYVERLEKRLGIVENERDAMEKRVHELEKERAELHKKIAEFEDEKKEWTKRNQELQSEIDTLRKRLDELNHKAEK